MSNYTRGMLHMMKEEYALAIEFFTICVKEDEINAPSAAYSLANCHYRLAEYDLVLSVLIETREVEYFWAAKNLAGRCCLYMGEYSSAIKYFEELGQEYNSVEIYANLCYAYIAEGDYLNAIKVLNLKLLRSYTRPVSYEMEPRSHVCELVYANARNNSMTLYQVLQEEIFQPN